MHPFHFVCILGTLALGTAFADTPETGQAAQTPEETFYQTVDIERAPRFLVQGLRINQQIGCRIESTFEIYAADLHGKRRAVQTITGAKLVQADPLSQAVFTQSLADMVGESFTFEVDKFANVQLVEGEQDNMKTVDIEKPKSKGVLVSNVIDQDGWTELAQLTLFQPPKTGRSNRPFVRKTTHDWGPLGQWYGKTSFAGRPFGRNTLRYNFRHDLEYIPPDQRDTKAEKELPFEISSAKFRLYEAWGEIHYDQKYKRVSKAREIFHARGTIVATMLGLPSNIELDERQVFTILVTGSRKLKVPPSTRTGPTPTRSSSER